MASKTVKNIPIPTAISLLALVVAAVIWASKTKASLDAAVDDRFRGADGDTMLIFIQDALDAHAEETGTRRVQLRSWRAPHRPIP